MAVKSRKVKVLSPSQVINKKRVIYDFDGRFLESFGKPERNAIWCIWGNSGNGKTRFLMELSKYLTRFGKVDYNSFEEGDSETVAKAFRETDMLDVNGSLKLIDNGPMDWFEDRLSKKRSAAFGVIDSVQYSGINYDRYKEFKENVRNKSLLFISHAKGYNPDGYTAEKIRYDASIKVHVVKFVAKVKSRYGTKAPFLIWEEGAKKEWGKRFKDVIAGKYWPGNL